MCRRINLKENGPIESNNVGNFLKLINSKVNKEIIKKTDFGCELYREFEVNGNTTVKNFLNWDSSINNILGLIREMLSSVSEVEITEYWGTTFQLRISKKEKITIGFLFGFFDEMKEKYNISEYFISQTSMEQIFNNFANQDDFEMKNDETEKLGGERKNNPKPIISLKSDNIERFFISESE